jgi:hypothetical protein
MLNLVYENVCKFRETFLRIRRTIVIFCVKKRSREPAVRYIFCSAPLHKRMPLPSGLGLHFQIKIFSQSDVIVGILMTVDFNHQFIGC